MSTDGNRIYQIGLKLDIHGGDLVPHSATSFLINGEEIIVYGFGPEEQRKTISAGKMYNDSNHDGFSQIQLYTVSEEDFIRGLEYAIKNYTDTPEYNLWFGAQCAIVSNNVLAKANVKGFHYVDMKPESFLKDVGDTIAINPYTQYDFDQAWNEALDNFADSFLPKIFAFNEWFDNVAESIKDGISDTAESIGDIIKDLDDKVEAFSAKLDGRDPSLGKEVLENLLFPIRDVLNKIGSEVENNISEFANDIKGAAQELMKDIDAFFAKIDGSDPSWGKVVLEKILELTKALDKAGGWIGEQFDWLPDDFKEWLNLNRSGKFHIYDPLVLDLDGDGIELIKANGWNGVQFDYNGDGIKSSTGWVKSDDGLLVWDRNGDGKINNGSEIFGEDMFPQKINHNISNTSSGSNSTSGGGMSFSDAPFNAIPIIENDGFYALSQLDSNHDGIIDANDANFNQIKVWRDLNQDGISQDGELFGLDELGIQAINLNTGNTKNNTAGNSIGKSSTYIKEDGSNGKIADVNFTLDTVHSEYIEHITIGDEQMLLPYLHGVGKLRDLREAATLSPELTDLLQQYQLATQKEQQTELLDNLMLFWARTNDLFHEKGISFAVGNIGASGGGSTGVTPSQVDEGGNDRIFCL